MNLISGDSMISDGILDGDLTVIRPQSIANNKDTDGYHVCW